MQPVQRQVDFRSRNRMSKTVTKRRKRAFIHSKEEEDVTTKDGKEYGVD